MLSKNNFILENFVEKALRSYDSGYINTHNKIMCRCKICNDSNYSKRKKRGYILKGSSKTNYSWTYYCHNGGCDCNDGISVEHWLSNYFPEIYSEYKRETVFNYNSEKYKTSKLKLTEKKIDEKEDVKHFIHILKGSGEIFENAIKYCEERKIPEKIWKEFFIATGGVFQGRMIIPFFDKDKKIYYYQGRTLIGSEPKYLNRRIGEKQIYNKDFINISKPVLIVEGPIDSMFLENGLAVLGLKFSDSVKKWLTSLNGFYILDNDPDGRKSSIRLLKKGKYIFCWNDFLKDLGLKNIKDINDLVLATGKEKWCYEDFEKYFTNNIFDELRFL